MFKFYDCRTIISPIVIAIIFFFSLITQLSYSMTYGKGTRIYIYPNWSIGLGWLLSIIPLLFIPGFIIYNIKKFNKKGLVSCMNNFTAINIFICFRVGKNYFVYNQNGHRFLGIECTALVE